MSAARLSDASCQPPVGRRSLITVVVVLGLLVVAYLMVMVQTMHVKSSIPLGPCGVIASPQINVVVTWVNVSEAAWGTSAVEAVQSSRWQRLLIERCRPPRSLPVADSSLPPPSPCA